MLTPDFYRKFGIYGGALYFTICCMSFPFFTLYASEFGASTAEIGLMITLAAFLPILIAMPVGQLIDTFGVLRLLQVGMLLLILALIANMMAVSLWMLFIAQILIGISNMMMASSLQVLVAEGSVNGNERNGNIKKFSLWTTLGLMLGPLIGGAVSMAFADVLTGYRFTFGLSSALSVLFIVFLFVIAKGYRHPKAAKTVETMELLKLKGIMGSYTSGIALTKSRGVQFGLIASFLIMFVQEIYTSFMPLYLKELGYSKLVITAMISARGFTGLLSQYALSWIMRLAHLERILIVAGFIAAFTLVLTPIAVLHVASVTVIVLVAGAATGINLPVSTMIMVNDIRDADLGKAVGLRLITGRLSQIVSPVTFGMVGQIAGLGISFYAGGIVLIGTMTGFSLFYKDKVSGIAKDEHSLR